MSRVSPGPAVSKWLETTTSALIADGVLAIGDGYRAKNAEFVEDGGLPFVRVADVTSRINLDGLDELPSDRRQHYEPKVARHGDCVITMKGSVGRVGYVAMETPFVYSPQLSFWRALDRSAIDPLFIRYWLKSPEFLEQASATKGATDMADYINLRDQRRMRITLPPIDEQRAIAQCLGAFDEAVEINERRIEVLEDLARSLYREWFVRFRFPGHENSKFVDSELGPIPEGWNVRPLGEVCSHVRAGSTPKRSDLANWEGGSIPWFKTGELHDGPLFDSEEHVTASAGARIFEPPTILMAIYGSPTVGRAGWVTRSSSCNQAALALLAHDPDTSQDWLWHQLAALRTDFNAMAQGAAQQNISKEKVISTRVVVPSTSVREAFSSVVVPLRRESFRCYEASRSLASARDLLLPRLVTGKLDISAIDLGVLTPSEAA